MANGTPFTGSYYVGMNTDNSATPVVSFEYGTVTTVEAVPPNTAAPKKNCAPDAASTFDKPTRVNTILVSADKAANPKGGDLVGPLVGPAFPAHGNSNLFS